MSFEKLACEQAQKLRYRARRTDSEAERAEPDFSLHPIRVPHLGPCSAIG